MTATRAERRGRFELVDTMRAFAALSVIAYHVSFYYPTPRPGIWNNVTQRNVGQPITGVVLFFLISGFVLYRPFVRARYSGDRVPALVPYGVRRMARIIPAYWVALAATTVWLGLGEVESVHGTVKYFGFLQVYGSLSGAVMGLGVAWSLCVEVTFYAALPVIALAMRQFSSRRSVLRSELVMCGVLGLVSLTWQVAVLRSSLINDTKLRLVMMTLPGSLDLFAAGMALAVVSVALEQRSRPPRWLEIVDRRPWVPWLLAIGVFFAIPRATNISGWGGFAGYIPAQWLKALACALLLLPTVVGRPGHGWLRRGLGWRPLVWLGEISYGIYLWHTTLLTKLAPHVVPHGRLVTLLAVTLATVVFAAASFYLVERPAQRFVRRLLSLRTHQLATTTARSP
jgi:peptidoglycan/LPS O-acetylase OafA/YrhL